MYPLAIQQPYQEDGRNHKGLLRITKPGSKWNSVVECPLTDCDTQEYNVPAYLMVGLLLSTIYFKLIHSLIPRPHPVPSQRVGSGNETS